MTLIIVLTIIIIGIILGLNNHPLLGFIIAVFGVAIVYLYDSIINLFNKLFKK